MAAGGHFVPPPLLKVKRWLLAAILAWGTGLGEQSGGGVCFVWGMEQPMLKIERCLLAAILTGFGGYVEGGDVE